MAIRPKWQNGILTYLDTSTLQTVYVMAPVIFQDHFLGNTVNKYAAGENTTAIWKTTETNLNTAIGVLANTPNGIAQITLDNDDNAEVGALYFGDQLCFSMKQGLVFETRMTFHVLPTTGTETVQAVFGLASAHNTTPDSIATNAWFRVESAAKTALLWETDDGNTDDDDNAAGITLVADTYHVYKIDCTNLATGIKFYVDGNLVGTSTDMNTNLTTAEAKVQPYFGLSKAVAANNTGTGTMYIDYVLCYQRLA
jgi:hypothetical protein